MDAALQTLFADYGPSSDGFGSLAAEPVPAAGVSDLVRRRTRADEIGVEVRSFPRRRQLPSKTTAAVMVLISPLSGSAEVTTGSGRHLLAPGSAMLLARSQTVAVAWSEGARGMILHLPRIGLQAAASEELGDPRRLSSIDLMVPCGVGAGSLALAMHDLVTGLAAAAPGGRYDGRLEKAMLTALVRTLAALESSPEILPVARSVKRAVDHIRKAGSQACDADELAAAAGVTAATLRQNFRSCLGVSVAAFVQNERLDWARVQLASGTESRPISLLAADVGFSSAGVFSRAYQRRFREAPSLTRARAVRMMVD